MKQNSGHPLGIWRWSRANARRVKRYRWGLGYLTGNLALSRGVGHGSGYLRHFVWVGPSPQALSQASGHHRSGCCSATTGSRSCKRSRRLFCPRVTFRRVVVSLRGPGQSPVLPFACCVGSLRSVGRCGRCSCWCRCRVRGAPSLVCRGCAECGGMCRLRVSGAH